MNAYRIINEPTPIEIAYGEHFADRVDDLLYDALRDLADQMLVKEGRISEVERAAGALDGFHDEAQAEEAYGEALDDAMERVMRAFAWMQVMVQEENAS